MSESARPPTRPPIDGMCSARVGACRIRIADRRAPARGSWRTMLRSWIPLQLEHCRAAHVGCRYVGCRCAVAIYWLYDDFVSVRCARAPVSNPALCRALTDMRPTRAPASGAAFNCWCASSAQHASWAPWRRYQPELSVGYSRSASSDTGRLPRPWHVQLQPQKMPFQRSGCVEVVTGGRRVTRDGLMPSGEAVERGSDRNRPRSRQQSSDGVKPRSHLAPDRGQAVPGAGRRAFISSRKHHPTSREHPPAGLSNPPGTKFAEILCLPAWHCAKEVVWWRSFVFSADADRRWRRSLTKMWRRSATSRACLSRARAGIDGKQKSGREWK